MNSSAVNAHPEQTPPWRIRIGLIVALALILSAVIALYHSLERQHQQHLQENFYRETLRISDGLRHHLEHYGALLYASALLLETSRSLSADEWRTYVASQPILQDYPGVEDFLVVGRQGNRFQTLQSLSGQRETPPLVLQQLLRHLATQDQSRTAMQLSLPLLGDDGEPRLYMVRPFSPSSTAGDSTWLLLALQPRQWLHPVLTHTGTAGISVAIYDVSNGHALPLITHQPGSGGANTLQHTLQVGQREWLLSFEAGPDFTAQLDSPLPLYTLLAGLLLSLALGIAGQRLTRSRNRALQQAQEMNNALQESESRYRALFDSSRAVQLLIDPSNQTVVAANEAALDYYGYSREQMIGLPVSRINVMSAQEIRERMGQTLRQRGATHQFQHRLASGELRDVTAQVGMLMAGGRQLLHTTVQDVTDRRIAEDTVQAREAYLSLLLKTIPHGIQENDCGGRIVYSSPAHHRILGHSDGELVGRNIWDFALNDEEAEQTRNYLAQLVQEQPTPTPFVTRNRRADGSIVDIEVDWNYHRDRDGKLLGFISTITDITERARAEEELRQAATFFETTSEAITITDADNRIIAVNPAFTAISGYSEAEVLGKDPGILSSGRQDRAFYQTMWLTLQRMGRWQGEIWNRRKSGEIYPEWLSIVAIKDKQGKVVQHMAIFSDITKRKRDEMKIWQQANFDALTGLPNRNLLMDRLSQALRLADRHEQQAALIFIDLDRFKWINDTLGHSAGDHLLQQAAERLQHCVRDADTVARLGGDEFTIVLPELPASSYPEDVAERILNSFAEPFLVRDRELYVGTSIGITLYPQDGREVTTLLRNADAAMYRAKAAGRNTFHYFTDEMNDQAQRRVRLESELRHALERRQISLHYQPIVDHHGQLAGAEALMRWHHPQLGVIRPDEFIQLAEETGMIIPIEHWALAEACSAARGWQQQAGRPLFVAVNISSTQCGCDDFPDVVSGVLSGTGFKPELLKLEITERTMMHDTEHVIALLSRLRALGVRLAMDDFGTGYSSLSYLKRFPIDVLKIDRAFIKDLPEDRDSAALVEAIIAMAHSLGLEVVSEGVETEQQQRFLQALGNDLFQGWLFDRAMPAGDFSAHVQRRCA